MFDDEDEVEYLGHETGMDAYNDSILNSWVEEHNLTTKWDFRRNLCQIRCGETTVAAFQFKFGKGWRGIRTQHARRKHIMGIRRAYEFFKQTNDEFRRWTPPLRDVIVDDTTFLPPPTQFATFDGPTVRITADLPTETAIDRIERNAYLTPGLILDRDARTLRILRVVDEDYTETIIQTAINIGGVGYALMRAVDSGEITRDTGAVEVVLDGVSPSGCPVLTEDAIRMRAALGG